MPDLSATPFQRRLTIVTMALLFVVLVIHLLQQFASILQPLLIAGFAAYVLLPVHRWLVQRGVRSKLAFALIAFVLLGAFVGLGQAIYSSVASITPERLEEYRKKLDSVVERTSRYIPHSGEESPQERWRRLLASSDVSTQSVMQNLRAVAGSFFGTLTFMLVVMIYLIFLTAEKLTFPRRLGMAFGDMQATQILIVVLSINEAIVRYIAVKTWISFLTALLSFLVFASFGLEFAVVWGILIFLLNFIPYLGSLIALAPPIALSFLQFETPWPGLAIIILLVGVQLLTGQYIEPRMAGKKLNLSPLLILLALAFWGYLWGVVGMILAVPLTVVCKIILDNIPETKPVGTLMSNV